MIAKLVREGTKLTSKFDHDILLSFSVLISGEALVLSSVVLLESTDSQNSFCSTIVVNFDVRGGIGNVHIPSSEFPLYLWIWVSAEAESYRDSIVLSTVSLVHDPRGEPRGTSVLFCICLVEILLCIWIQQWNDFLVLVEDRRRRGHESGWG